MVCPRVSLLALSALVLSAPLAAAQPSGNPGPLGQHVDPRMGTGGIPWASGSVSPAAQVPFGMVQLGPDTAPLFGRGLSGNMRTSGYYYLDPKMWGFSHTRLSGTGASDGGLFRVVPRTTRIKGKHRKKGKKTWLLHRRERATPGYYAVRLRAERVLAEMTASTHVGVHRYTFDADRDGKLMIYASSFLDRDGTTDEAQISIDPQTGELEGKCRLWDDFSGRQGGLRAYFVARFEPPFSEWGTWHGEDYAAGSTQRAGQKKGDSVGAQLGYGKSSQPRVVTVKVALSYVSVANARLNLNAEAPAGVSFDDVHARAVNTWEQALGRAPMQGGTREQREIYTTSLYRSMLMPTHYTDVNGEYPGFDGQTHVANGWTYYSNLSLWDTFRTTHPLFTLIAREEQADFCNSLIHMAEQGGGWLPRWPAGVWYSGSMLGNNSAIVISESYQKGIRGYDVNKAYAAMKLTATTLPPAGSRIAACSGIDDYQRLGWCPADRMEEAVSRTLEYAYADDSIARIATLLGQTTDAQTYAARSKNYRNTWNPRTQYFHPRNEDGSYQKRFFPWLLTYLDLTGGKYTNDYVEGSPKQWRWVPLYDAPGLVSLFRSTRYFTDELKDFFEKAVGGRGTIYPGSNYWHGNEPDLHAAYLFNYVSRPDLTQKWVRWVLDTKYGTGPAGLDGQDDGGTLSAWYVFSALGFYPIAGTDRYLIGSPLHGGAVDVGGGRKLVVLVSNPGKKYIQSVHLGGQPLNTPWFDHHQIANGSTLQFVMGDQPSGWGR